MELPDQDLSVLQLNISDFLFLFNGNYSPVNFTVQT